MDGDRGISHGCTDFSGRYGYEQFAPAPGGSRATCKSRMAEFSGYRMACCSRFPRVWNLRDGEILRTAAGSHAVVKLMDRSLVEVGERAGVSSCRAARRDMTVHLNRGAVIVQAAKRRQGSFVCGDRRFASGRYGDRLFCQSWSQRNTRLRG